MCNLSIVLMIFYASSFWSSSTNSIRDLWMGKMNKHPISSIKGLVWICFQKYISIFKTKVKWVISLNWNYRNNHKSKNWIIAAKKGSTLLSDDRAIQIAHKSRDFHDDKLGWFCFGVNFRSDSVENVMYSPISHTLPLSFLSI